jgi:hypothetical protein
MVNLNCVRLVTATVVALTLNARASIVTVQANDSSGFSYFEGGDLDFGVSVLLGTFQLADGSALSDSAIQGFGSDFNTLMTHFTRFSTTEAHIGQGSPNQGELSVDLEATADTTPPIAGKQIYYLVVSGTDNTTVASSLTTARQFGIYYLDKSANSRWAFPVPTDDDTDITIVDIADLTVGNLGLNLLPGGVSHTVIGTFGTDHSNAHPSAINFELAVIPEPSVGALALLASAALAARRRRRPAGPPV